MKKICILRLLEAAKRITWLSCYLASIEYSDSLFTTFLCENSIELITFTWTCPALLLVEMRGQTLWDKGHRRRGRPDVPDMTCHGDGKMQTVPNDCRSQIILRIIFRIRLDWFCCVKNCFNTNMSNCSKWKYGHCNIYPVTDIAL